MPARRMAPTTASASVSVSASTGGAFSAASAALKLARSTCASNSGMSYFTFRYSASRVSASAAQDRAIQSERTRQSTVNTFFMAFLLAINRPFIGFVRIFSYFKAKVNYISCCYCKNNEFTSCHVCSMFAFQRSVRFFPRARRYAIILFRGIISNPSGGIRHGTRPEQHPSKPEHPAAGIHQKRHHAPEHHCRRIQLLR